MDLLQEKEQIQKYRDQGLTVKQIADIYKTSKTTMGRVIKNLGLSQPSDRLDVTVEAVCNLYNNGMTANEIARHYHIGCDAILKRLRKAGIYADRSENIRKHFVRSHEELWSDIQSDLNLGLSKKDTAKKYHMRIEHLNTLISNHNYQRPKKDS